MSLPQRRGDKVVALAAHRRREATRGFAPLLDGLLEAVWLVETKSLHIVAANAAAAQLLGVSVESLIGRSVESLSCSPEDMMFWAEAASGSRVPLCSDTLVRHASGKTLWVTRRATSVTVGGETMWMVALLDRSAERAQQEERETLVAELRATLESTADAILVTDLAGRMRAFNQRFAAMWGIPEDLLRDKDDEAVRAWMRRSVQDGAAYQQRVTAIEDAPLSQSADMLTLLDGRVIERVSLPQWNRDRPIGRVYSYRDLSEKIAAHQRIEELSFTDMLTGLPNRRALHQRLGEVLGQARRNNGNVALLNVDLDRFKQINDTLGQSYGDRVLKEVAERLRACIGSADMVARLAADSFALLLVQGSNVGAEAVARRVQEAMARPFSFDTLNFTVTNSTGIAIFPRDGAAEDELLASAERAMHWVKESGRGTFRFHQPGKDVDLLSRMQLDHAMRRALAEREFQLHYQPQVCLTSGRVIGAEALIRWVDPLRGEISPGEFIPVAEESGFIVAIGDWVLFEAVRQAASWLRLARRMPVSVNVSALQFQQADFVEKVANALDAAALPPELLELELTESVLLSDADEALKRMQQLRALGVSLSIDDFGTGYSSISYLKRFPIQRLKIDRSFVRGLPGDAGDVGIINAIIQMGRALSLQVIAEGVEHPAQREFLARAGCHEMQGFLHAPALRAAEFERCVWSAAPGFRPLAGPGFPGR
ncbi:MAG TPA: EAL domain-containing protein [Burkholderiaceae bacterium]